MWKLVSRSFAVRAAVERSRGAAATRGRHRRANPNAAISGSSIGDHSVAVTILEAPMLCVGFSRGEGGGSSLTTAIPDLSVLEKDCSHLPNLSTFETDKLMQLLPPRSAPGAWPPRKRGTPKDRKEWRPTGRRPRLPGRLTALLVVLAAQAAHPQCWLCCCGTVQ